MPDDHFNYDQLMLDAHRELIRQVLLKVEQTGLPGEHHFFIIFSTTHKGTRVSDRLHAQYPKEMTIVLQHQYSNLKIYEDYFEIQLSFNRIPELLVIPFSAITGFVDPSVPFGLQLASEAPAGLENSIGMLAPGLPQISAKGEASKKNAKSTKDDDTIEYNVSSSDNSDEDFTSTWDSEETSVPTVFPTKNKLRNTDIDETDEPQPSEEIAQIVENDDEDEDEENSANIVQLDAFRKKSK